MKIKLFIVSISLLLLISCNTSQSHKPSEKKQLGMIFDPRKDPECYKDTKLVKEQPGTIFYPWTYLQSIKDIQYTCFSKNGINYFWMKYPAKATFLFVWTWPQTLLSPNQFKSMAQNYCKREYNKKAVYVGSPLSYLNGWDGRQYNCV